MKRSLLTILSLLFVLRLATAQPGPGPQPYNQDMKERIIEAKKKFLSEELALSESQKTKFWPIYQEFDKEMEANHDQIKGIKRGFNVKSDSELKSDINRFLTLKEEAVAIERKYFAKFQDVLSIRQVAVLYQSEQKFKRLLVEQLRQQRQGAGRRGRLGIDKK